MKMKRMLLFAICAFALCSCAVYGDICVESNPSGAEVYIVSKRFASKFSSTDKEFFKDYPVNEGNTPVVTMQKCKKFKVYVVKNGEVQVREADLLNSTDTVFIKVNFE